MSEMLEIVKKQIYDLLNNNIAKSLKQFEGNTIDLDVVKLFIIKFLSKELDVCLINLVDFKLCLNGDIIECKPNNLFTAAILNGEEVGIYTINWKKADKYIGKNGTYIHQGSDIVYIPHISSKVVSFQFNV